MSRVDPERVRVGIVGAGGNTRSKHIPGLRAIEGVEIVSVCNRSRASSEKAAAELGIPRIHDDWRSLVEAPDTDAIVIGTWPYLHCRTTVAALEAGRHVLCEARMAMDAREARLMRDAAAARPDLVAQLVPAPHTLGVDRTVQRMIGEGFLGEPLAIEVRAIEGGFIERDAALHWRQDADLSGRNIMSLGIWYESLQRWVGDATSVTAAARVFVRQRRDPATGAWRAISVPDHLDVVAEMACGAQAHFVVSSAMGLAGADGITVHPRPDERHIRRTDVYDLAVLVREEYAGRVELNIEGNPTPELRALLADVRPDQATLVPDDPAQATSDHGWDPDAPISRGLADVVAEIRDRGMRVSLFMDADVSMIERVHNTGADRIELYTGPWAYAFGGSDEDRVLRTFVEAAAAARRLGLGLNAGHDLNLENLPRLQAAIPGIDEVSIGHAITADALKMGFAPAVRAYRRVLSGTAA